MSNSRFGRQLFSSIAQGFASALRTIPLAFHQDELHAAAGNCVTAALWARLAISKRLPFVGFWALGLVLVLDAARRAAPNA